MKIIECTFYRPTHVNIGEFQNIADKLESDLYIVCDDGTPENVVRSYAESLAALAEPLKKNPEMYFLGLDEPDKMPSDARVDFFYKPTYIGTAIIMKAVMKYPDLLKMYERVFHGLLLGCTGRGFKGHGFDDLRGMIETLKIFTTADCEIFVEKYPEVCIEFTNLYKEAMKELENRFEEGRVCNEWGEDYSGIAKEVLSLSGQK